MDGLAHVLDAIAALAWPLLLGIVLFRLRRILPEVLESAKSRRFTIKLAGNELTMEEASEQQRRLISDLQEKVVALEAQMQTAVPVEPFAPRLELGSSREIATPKAAEEKDKSVRSILWVDDNPRNNASLIAHFEDLGIRVVTARSTSEGMQQLASGVFDRVITDIGREENGEYRRSAGIELIRRVREEDRDIPILVYTSTAGARHRGREAREAGANLVTPSPTSLLQGLSL